ncbi:MAG TPA: YihY/virulence factor BrkB family protein [Promineifilum sp.]|nr:YihY/virulence factor BrkB family protein [Promineifilum sp.]HRO23849.1 YihY/virulence factor BrkB family protein [Promineifilum sp.]HRO89956.1 YihY/virulence factor BrkB family protein [Promineifilum sp.]HRQ11949.1 YihY/virulence factor BrkB family protein [Promineifilum sp.]
MGNVLNQLQKSPLGLISQVRTGFLPAIKLWGGLTLRSIQDALAPESQLVASSIGYFTLFSVFPLALLVVAIASNWLDPMLAEARIVAELEFIIPGLETMLGENLQNLIRARGPITGVAAIMLIWSASSVFNVVTRAMDRIWGADINHRRSVWRHRTLAVGMVLIITMLLLLASSIEGTVLTIINSLVPSTLMDIGPFTTSFWAVFLNVLLFSLLYYFIPHVKIGWREVIPGAIMAGLMWHFAKQLFLYFVGTYLSRSNLIYGSVGTIIAFLTWTYISSLVLLCGAYLNRYAAAYRQLGPSATFRAIE